MLCDSWRSCDTQCRLYPLPPTAIYSFLTSDAKCLYRKHTQQGRAGKFQSTHEDTHQWLSFPRRSKLKASFCFKRFAQVIFAFASTVAVDSGGPCHAFVVCAPQVNIGNDLLVFMLLPPVFAFPPHSKLGDAPGMNYVRGSCTRILWVCDFKELSRRWPARKNKSFESFDWSSMHKFVFFTGNTSEMTTVSSLHDAPWFTADRCYTGKFGLPKPPSKHSIQTVIRSRQIKVTFTLHYV